MKAQTDPTLLELPGDMQALLLRIVELLQNFGPQRVGLPHIRRLIWTLQRMRMQGRDGIARALHIAVQGCRLETLP